MQRFVNESAQNCKPLALNIICNNYGYVSTCSFRASDEEFPKDYTAITCLQYFSTTSSRQTGRDLTPPSMSFEICIIGCKLRIVRLQNLSSIFPQLFPTTTMMYMSTPPRLEHHMPSMLNRQIFSQINKLSSIWLHHIYNSTCQTGHYHSIPKGRPTGRMLRHKTWCVALPN
jgi:hypothetical protein